MSGAPGASVPIPKFANARGTLSCELRNHRDTSNSMILVPLLNPKFAIGLSAWACELRVRGTRGDYSNDKDHHDDIDFAPRPFRCDAHGAVAARAPPGHRACLGRPGHRRLRSEDRKS